MKNILNIVVSNRNVCLYKNKSDITRKGNIKIMKYSDKGFFYLEHNKMFDVHGQFDILFDQGQWNNNFMKNSILA